MTFILISALLVTMGVVGLGSARRFETAGYSSPEAAVQAYLDAMKRSDVDAMIATFAVETYVEHYDIEAYVERMRAYPASFQGNFPAGRVNDDFNRYARLSEVAQQVSCQYRVLSDSDIDTTQMIAAADDAAAAELIDRLKNSFDGTAFGRVSRAKQVDLESELPEVSALLDNPSLNETMRAMQRYLGADEIAERLVRLSADGGEYYMSVELYRYGSTWHVGSLRGILTALQSLPATAGGAPEDLVGQARQIRLR